MTTYGYIWREKMLDIHDNNAYDCSSLDAFIADISARATPDWKKHYESIQAERLLLEPHVDKLVHVADFRQVFAWRHFVSTINAGDKVLVLSYDGIELNTRRLVQCLNDAHAERKLVVSLKEASLLKLDIDIALELHQQWVMTALVSSIDNEANDTYEKLRGLIQSGLTGDQIAEQMGVSRSTVFRLRREFYDRLVDDVPGFGKPSGS